MSDLIDRRAAIDALGEKEELSDTWADEYEVGRFQQWRDDVEALRKLPSAQPERCEDCINFGKTRLLIPQPERKKGRWLGEHEIKPFSHPYSITYKCSECGYAVYTLFGMPPLTKFCSNCGAEMEGVE